MANNYTFRSRNIMLDSLPNAMYVSVHDLDPGENGTNEVAGTTREQINLSAAANGIREAVEDFVDIEVSDGDTVSFVGLFDAATGGNFIAYVDVNDVNFSSNSVYRVSDISIDLNLT